MLHNPFDPAGSILELILFSDEILNMYDNEDNGDESSPVLSKYSAEELQIKGNSHFEY